MYLLGNRAEADLILPHTLINQEPPPTNDASGNSTVNDDDEEEDDSIVAGPTVEACINLGRRSCA
jgi:hypothetical protein